MNAQTTPLKLGNNMHDSKSITPKATRLLKRTPFKTPKSGLQQISKIQLKRSRENPSSINQERLDARIMCVGESTATFPLTKTKQSYNIFFRGKRPGECNSKLLCHQFKLPEDILYLSSCMSAQYTFPEGGFVEAYSWLLKSGVDSRMISLEWTKNHYRWIVWKLASLARNFPDKCSTFFTFMMVCSQLKNRYFIEQIQLRHSALKQIIQRDNFSSRFMILCVSQIRPCTSDQCEGCVELTDCWYSIQCKLDSFLHELVQKGKITVGMKLRIFGASLTGGSEPCDPLENKESKLVLYLLVLQKFIPQEFVGIIMELLELNGIPSLDTKKNFVSKFLCIA